MYQAQLFPPPHEARASSYAGKIGTGDEATRNYTCCSARPLHIVHSSYTIFYVNKSLIFLCMHTMNRIDFGFVIKVADFGLSESLDTSKEYFREIEGDTAKLPIKWLALESITDGVFSEKTDVVWLLCEHMQTCYESIVVSCSGHLV